MSKIDLTKEPDVFNKIIHPTHFRDFLLGNDYSTFARMIVNKYFLTDVQWLEIRKEWDIKEAILNERHDYEPEPVRQFRVANSDVWFGLYKPKGGCIGEFNVYWHYVGPHLTPQLRVLDNSWGVLNSMPDVFNCMAEVDNENITVDEFCAMLESCGFEQIKNN